MLVKKQFALYFFILLFLGVGTTLVVLHGKGYRFTREQGRIGVLGTGLLVATSRPDAAEIFINSHLTSATNNTINLAPSEYNIRIVKQGYFPWEKKIKIQKEVVSRADALLFPTAPKLENITDNGIANPVVDPSGTQIAFTVASESARKNGVYILDMSARPILTLQSASTQIADDTTDAFSESLLSWSPDGKQLLASVSAGIKAPPTTYLLDARSFNQYPRDVTETLSEVNTTWQKQKDEKEKSQIFGLKETLKNLIIQNFSIISWSPDETKILYQASQSATIPPIIVPPLIGTDSTEEKRSIDKNSIYVYDIKEDKNFRILDSLPNSRLSRPTSPASELAGGRATPDSQLPLTWFPDSKHLVFVNNREIAIMEYDGANKTVIYAGPFIKAYVFPWPDGSKLVILTDLGNQNIVPNLYTIGLK